MRKKRIMLIGPSGSGKTALANELNGGVGPLRRSQDTIYGENTIDVPGAYLENRMYSRLLALSQDAYCILLLLDRGRSGQVYSPGFAKAFARPVCGVITKGDLDRRSGEDCRECGQSRECETQLRNSGVSGPIFTISVSENWGVAELKAHLAEMRERQGRI